MKIYPAIDLYAGKAVRLYQGDYDKMTVYDGEPAALARRFRECGAENLHLVDLEGARSGRTPNLGVIQKIVREAGLFCEVGGGIRDFSVIETYLSAGVSRVILGTAAVTESGFVSEAVRRYGTDRVAVGVDIRDGFVAIRGWTEQSALHYADFLARLLSDGVTTIICTDISRDGAMRGQVLRCTVRYRSGIRRFLSSRPAAYPRSTTSVRSRASAFPARSLARRIIRVRWTSEKRWRRQDDDKTNYSMP